MTTRRVKQAWVNGKVTTAEREALERLADAQFESNLSAALRHCIRKATADGRPPRPVGVAM